MQVQSVTPHWPRHQASHGSLSATLPQPEPNKPVTDEEFRQHLADLGAPTGKFRPREHRVGRPRECELAAPKQKDYTAGDFGRAQRYYRKYHNAWRKFNSAKSRLEEAPSQEKGKLQKLTLKNAELLRSTKEA